jgi:hypothetical protein
MTRHFPRKAQRRLRDTRRRVLSRTGGERSRSRCGAPSQHRRGVAALVLVAGAPVSGRDAHVLLLRALVFEV